jgi:hypothetical protein
VLGSCAGFTMAVNGFAEAVRQAAVPDEEWLLIGRRYGESALADGEQLSEDGLILLYRSRPAVEGSVRKGKLEVEQVTDPTEPVQVQTPYFVSYDRKHGQLRFYDGILRGVRPGGWLVRMDLGYFDFDFADIFVEG